MADFLMEIGTEELPSGMVEGLFTELGRRVEEGLRAKNLAYGACRSFGAPRRIGLLVTGLLPRQPDRVETVCGPPMKVAKDDGGAWTRAAEGFARKQGVALAGLREVEGPKGPVAGFEREVKGKPAGEILSRLVPEAVDALYLPKSMRWGRGDEAFVRPVRWVVALLDGEIIPMEVKGLPAGRVSRGHRVYGPQSVPISSPSDYDSALREANVMADPGKREESIRAALTEKARECGGRPPEDDALLRKLVYLAEVPTVITGTIGEEFLDLPREILATCLREHQNVFVVADEGDRILPRFLAVIDAPEDPRGLIRKGLENVSASRLADARFFYENDLKVPLEDRLEALKGIVFHPKLGTYYDKALRMEALARKIAPLFNADEEEAAWAAKHAKCDLASLLIQEKEFVSLQGKAGGLFAAAQGKGPAVTEAIYDQYLPASPSDSLPRGAVGAVVAASDKLDTLREMFRVGLAPSGSKDPFALRRAAMGLLRILIESPSCQGLDVGAFLDSEGVPAEDLREFLAGRLRYLWGEQGFAYDEINSVLAFGLNDPRVLDEKLRALAAVRSRFREDFDALSVAFKRSKNILRGLPPYGLDPDCFLPESEREGAGEHALFDAFTTVKKEAMTEIDASRWEGALTALARIRPAVDRFFDDVLVMCDPEEKDPEKTILQRNRLALLQRLVALFDLVADFGAIVPQDED